MRWFAPEDQPAKPATKTASTRKTASIREVYKGSDQNVADALARIEGEHSKVRVMRGPDRKPIPGAINIWNSAKRALTDLALMLGGGEAASGEGVTQQPEPEAKPEPSQYLSTSRSRRQVKTAQPFSGTPPTEEEWLAVYDRLFGEDVLGEEARKDPRHQPPEDPDEKWLSMAEEDIMGEQRKRWSKDPSYEPSPLEGLGTDPREMLAADGHWVKTAGETVQCGNCDRHVDEDDIDATGKCSTCQEEHDTMEQQEVEKLN